jgi:2-hydroxychromene-2-carboxylate isomerase
VSSPVRFLFDYVSPYSYLASTQIPVLAARHGREVEAVPVLFAGLLEASGGRGPAEIPAKREYMFRDVLRIARALNVPLEPPATHPFNPLMALRATACVVDSPSRWQLVHALFRAAWVQSMRVDQAEVVARVAAEAGLDGQALLEQTASVEAKARLRQSTEEAVRVGAFGVPTMLVDGELFWGVDSLPHVERCLSGEKGPDATTVARWGRVQPSAVRPTSR